jgi:ferricrocin synthase
MEEATARRIVDRVSELLLNPMMPIIIHSAVVKATRPSLTQYDESQWTPTEEIIRNTVAQLCEVDKTAVTKNMSFLRLGLDSISSIRLAQSLRAAGIKARSVDILKFPTVGALASYVAEMDDSADLAIDPKSLFSAACAQLTTETMSTIPLLSPTDSIVSIHPASALQSAMLTSTLSSTGTLYVVSHPLALSSSVDLARLRIAWGKVISQSEILRTSFHLGTSVPWVGAIHKDAPLHWHEEVIGNDNQLSEVIQRLSLGAAILEPEALEKPPVIIYLLVCPSKRVLLPIMHHR